MNDQLLTVRDIESWLGLANAFSPHAIFISEEMGIAKPHPKIFRIACDRLAVDPSEALYIGNSALMDIDPAHEAGMHTALRLGSGNHAGVKGKYEPEFAVNDFHELLEIMQHRFGVALAS